MFLIKRSFINRTVGFMVLLAITLLPACNKDGDKVSVEVKNGVVSISFETPFASDVLYDNIVVTISPDGEGEDIVYESVNDVPEQLELPAGEYLVTIKGTSTLIEVFGVVIDDELEIEVIEGESMEYSFNVVGETYDIYWKLEKIQDGCEDDSDPEDIILRVSLTNKDGDQIPNLINRTLTVDLNFSGIDEDEFDDDFPEKASIPFNGEFTDIKLVPDDDNDVEGTRVLTLTLANPSVGSLLKNNEMASASLFNDDFCATNLFTTVNPNVLFDILSVELNDLVNTSEKIGNGDHYSYNETKTTNLTGGSSYSIELEVSNSWVSNLFNVTAVWIDFDQDGDFDNSERLLFPRTFINTGSSTSYSGTINVPADAKSGKTRLRITTMYNSTPPACGQINYGEVEDYTITIN